MILENKYISACHGTAWQRLRRFLAMNSQTRHSRRDNPQLQSASPLPPALHGSRSLWRAHIYILKVECANLMQIVSVCQLFTILFSVPSNNYLLGY